VDQPFENEVMQDLAGKTPPSSAEEAFEEGAGMGDHAFEDEHYLQEDAMAAGLEGMDAAEGDAFLAEESPMEGFEEDVGEELAEGRRETWEALEEVMADAFDRRGQRRVSTDRLGSERGGLACCANRTLNGLET